MHPMHNTPEESPAQQTNTAHYHAVVWLDHHEAKIAHFNIQASDEDVVRPADPPRHLHIQAGSASGTHVTVEPAFYRDVANACDGAHAILLVGPSTAKEEFVTYLRKHSPQTFDRIAGIEALADATDRQLLAEGRRFFSKADRLTPRTA